MATPTRPPPGSRAAAAFLPPSAAVLWPPTVLGSMSGGSYVSGDPQQPWAAVTGQSAVLSSHPEKTHPDFWSSSAMGGPAWAAGERSQRGAHPQLGPVASSGAFTSLRVGGMPYFFPTVQRGGTSRCPQRACLPTATMEEGIGPLRRSLREDMKSIL